MKIFKSIALFGYKVVFKIAGTALPKKKNRRWDKCVPQKAHMQRGQLKTCKRRDTGPLYTKAVKLGVGPAI